MLQLSGITKAFGKKIILKELNLEIRFNSCYALVGKNGAGKSTLLNIIYGLHKAEKGKVVITDEQGNELSVIRGEIAFYQGVELLIEEMTGFEYLRFMSLMFNKTKAITEEEINELFKFFFETANALHQHIRTYSFGMKQKIALCGAIINSPKVLILDEPFAGLDPYSAEKLVQFINTYRQNRIVLISSHDLTILSQVATDIVILDDHRFIYTDSLANFTINGFRSLSESLFELVRPKVTDMERSLNFILSR